MHDDEVLGRGIGERFAKRPDHLFVERHRGAAAQFVEKEASVGERRELLTDRHVFLIADPGDAVARGAKERQEYIFLRAFFRCGEGEHVLKRRDGARRHGPGVLEDFQRRRERLGETAKLRRRIEFIPVERPGLRIDALADHPDDGAGTRVGLREKRLAAIQKRVARSEGLRPVRLHLFDVRDPARPIEKRRETTPGPHAVCGGRHDDEKADQNSGGPARDGSVAFAQFRDKAQ